MTAASGADPAEIVRQRAAGWPDFHPEDYCHKCGRPNPTWFADTAEWQTATGSEGDGGGILCPSCFCALWEQVTGRTAIIWRLSIDPRSRDTAPASGADRQPCRVVVDGDDDETFLVCLTCDPGREVCCGHHLAPHYEDGCHELVAAIKCACARRPLPASGTDQPTLRDQLANAYARWHAAPNEPDDWQVGVGADLADALLSLIEPHVERAKAEAAAEALETAATDAGLPGVFPSTQRWLLARAAALRANAGGDRS